LNFFQKVARIAPRADAFCSAGATNLFTWRWSAADLNHLVKRSEGNGLKVLSICISIGWKKKTKEFQ
jgi:hypothetical protein